MRNKLSKQEVEQRLDDLIRELAEIGVALQLLRQKISHIEKHGGNRHELASLKDEVERREKRLFARSAQTSAIAAEYQEACTPDPDKEHRQRLNRKIKKHGLKWLNEQQRAIDEKLQHNAALAQRAGYIAPVCLGPGPHPSPEQQQIEFRAVIKAQRAREQQAKASHAGSAVLSKLGDPSRQRVEVEWQRLDIDDERQHCAAIAKALKADGFVSPVTNKPLTVRQVRRIVEKMQLRSGMHNSA